MSEEELRAAANRVRARRQSSDDHDGGYPAALGRLQSAIDHAALADAYLAANPVDDGELLSESYIRSVIPTLRPSINHIGELASDWGSVTWREDTSEGFQMWVNDGRYYPWREVTKRQFRALLTGLGIPLTEAIR